MQMLFDKVTVQFHHSDFFTDPPNSIYIRGVVDEIIDFDIDKASFFDEIIDIDKASDKDVVVLLEHYKGSEVLTIYVERGHEPFW